MVSLYAFILTGFRPHQGIILFNMAERKYTAVTDTDNMFPSPSGDYFI